MLPFCNPPHIGHSTIVELAAKVAAESGRWRPGGSSATIEKS